MNEVEAPLTDQERLLFEQQALSSGLIHVTITYLEMKRHPGRPAVDLPESADLHLMPVKRPSVAFYRFLYNTIGGPWLWWERRQMSDRQLAEVLADPAIELTVLHADGSPAAMVELERHGPEFGPPDTVNLAYFGLMPEWIGHGIGPWLLDWAIGRAWDHHPRTVTVNTCTLDHPAALRLYQKAGFTVYRTETVVTMDPRLDPVWHEHRV